MPLSVPHRRVPPAFPGLPALGPSATLAAEPACVMDSAGIYTASRTLFQRAAPRTVKEAPDDFYHWRANSAAAAASENALLSKSFSAQKAQAVYIETHPPPRGCSWEPPVQRTLRSAKGTAPTVAVIAQGPKAPVECFSELLHFHAKLFPPPPPPRLPAGTPWARAELWFHTASQWDISHRLPPPPRAPLQEGQWDQRRERAVPYRMDRWMQICERWFDVVQGQFDYQLLGGPMTLEAPADFVLFHAVCY